jgi:hypothetical protein
MKLSIKSALTGVTALAVAGGALLVSAGAASAAAPTFEPSQGEVGTLSFYDASGNQITSGNLDAAPFATYYVGSGGATPTSTAPANTKATVYFRIPQDGVDARNWNGDQLTGAATYGAAASASYPAPLTGSPNAIGKGAASDIPLGTFLPDWTLGSTLNPNVVQIRVTTGNVDEYYAADIVVDQVNHTWTQTYPAPSITTVPGAPTAVSATARNASALLVWTAPAADGGSPITGYTVQYSSNGGTTWSVDQSAMASPFTVSGLTNGAAYVFHVAAKNVVGTGAYSANSTAVTPVVPVTVPASVAKPTLAATAVATATTGSIKVTWAAPANGGSAITGYTVAWAKHGTTSFAAKALGATGTFTIAGLAKNTAYDVKVLARNAKGSGAYSAVATAKVPPTAPAAVGTPTLAAAAKTNVPTGTIKVAWKAPVNGGVAIAGYVVQYKLHTTKVYTSKALGNVLTVTLTGLKKNVAYDVRVAARNAKGLGAYSGVRTVAVPATVPGRVAKFSVKAGSKSFTGRWSKPLDNGGAAVKSYVVQYKLSSAKKYITKTVSASKLKLIVKRLKKGKTYTVRVAAKNAKGVGAYSAVKRVKIK